MSIRLKALLLAGPVTILALLIITSLVGAGSLLWVAAGSPPDPAHDFALLWIFRGALRPLLVLAAIMGTLAVGRIAYALLARIPTSSGKDLSRREAPVLWDQLDRLCWRVGAPTIHRVRLTEACNAGIRTDRPWRVGPRRNTLELGLPLLRLMDVGEATSVVVHELAHLRHQDGRLGGVLGYTGGLLLALSRLQRHDPDAPTDLLCRMADGFFVQVMRTRRISEMDADAVAVAHAGPECAGRALLRLALADRRVLEHWRDLVHEGVPLEEGGAPVWPRGTFELASRTDPRDLGWLRTELARPTSPDAGHPSLTERLKAMGACARVNAVPPPVPESDSAAFAWLGTTLPTWITTQQRLPAGPSADNRPGTQPDAAALQEALRDLCTRIKDLDVTLLKALWQLSRRHGDSDAAHLAMQEILARDFREPEMLEWTLRALLRSPDPSHQAAGDGVAARLAEAGVDKAAAAIDAWAQACAMRGDAVRAHATWRMLDLARLGREHPGFRPEAWIEPADLSPHTLDSEPCVSLQSITLSRPWIDHAWLVRLHAEADLGPAAHALVVQRHPETWWRGSRSRRERDRLALARAVGCGVAVLELGALPRATQERLRAMPGTRIT